jgi:hypothetical protein
MFGRLWNYLYYPSPQSVLDNTDAGNNSTYTQAQYQARPAQQWGGKNIVQFNNIQGPYYGASSNNNYGSDYFMDAYGYMVGYAPAVAPTEPTTYGAGEWVTVNGEKQYVAQPLPSTAWPTRNPV